MIPNTGLAITTNRVVGAGTVPKWIDWGTGTTAPAVGNTALETVKSNEARTVGTASQDTTTTTSDTYKVVGTITCAVAGAAITEVGLFDALTSGNLFLRGTFSAINLNVADSIEFTINTVYDQG
jgi:tetrahydromethanopterin S-methyltransferase subunit C